jgi:hypothetical protein
MPVAASLSGPMSGHIREEHTSLTPIPAFVRLQSMHTDWTTPYHVAMCEQNKMKLEGRYEVARHAIHNRILELGKDTADIRELRALEEALHQLNLHRYRATLVA